MFTRNIATEEAIKSDRTQIKARVILSAQLLVPQLTHPSKAGVSITIHA